MTHWDLAEEIILNREIIAAQFESLAPAVLQPQFYYDSRRNVMVVWNIPLQQLRVDVDVRAAPSRQNHENGVVATFNCDEYIVE